jgi:nitroreductase
MARDAQHSDRDVVEHIVKAATCAPSLHNSQPWRFVAALRPGSARDHIDLFAERERAAWAVDGADRSLHLACGAAIELGRVAARGLGRDADVELLPDPERADLLARLYLGGAYTPDEHDVRLAESIALRYTERDRFDEREIAEADLDALRASVTLDQTWLKLLERSSDQIELYVLLDRADEIELRDPRYLEELRRWVRTEDTAPDGIPLEALGEVPVADRASSLRLRDFLPDRSPPRTDTAGTDTGGPDAGGNNAGGDEASQPPPVPEHPLVAVVGTIADDPVSWLQAGRAVASLLLEATSRKISASPMTQVLEVEATRVALMHALGVLGHPQMLLRMGYASGHPSTPRRPVDEVLRYE